MASELFEKHVLLRISGDKLRASLWILPGIAPDLVDRASIDGLVSARNLLRSTVDSDQIDRAIAQYAADQSAAVEADIALGTPPDDGEDGRFELDQSIVDAEEHRQETNEHDAASGAGSDSGPIPGPDSDPDTNAFDHYSQSAFVIVHAGDPIGRLIEPTEGTDGIDVFGATIPARRGRRPDLHIDESIQVLRDGIAVAKVAGELHHTSIELRVNTELDIRENIDFSTGHVRFPGSVVVRGSIKDRFRVECGKSLRVVGLVEAATLIAELDIELVTGIAGREQGRVVAGRDLTAGYLDGAIIDAERDCIVANEIGNATVTVGRHLVISNGAIRGATVCCGLSCEAGVIGAAKGQRTTITIGRIAHIDAVAREAESLTPVLEKLLAAGNERRTQILNATRKLAPAQAEELCEIEHSIQVARTLIGRVESGRDRLRTLVSGQNELVLTIRRALHRDCNIVLGPFVLRPKDEMKGPFQIVLPPAGSPEIINLSTKLRAPAASAMSVTRAPDAIDFRAAPTPHEPRRAA